MYSENMYDITLVRYSLYYGTILIAMLPDSGHLMFFSILTLILDVLLEVKMISWPLVGHHKSIWPLAGS